MHYPRFLIFRNTEGKYYYRLYNERGKILLTGSACDVRFGCINDIRQLYAFMDDSKHCRTVTATGQFYFHFTNDQQRVIGTSEVYRTPTGMAFGIHTVKKSVSRAVIEDCVSNVRLITR